MDQVNINMLEAGLCHLAPEEDTASELAFTEKKTAYNVTSLHKLANILSKDPDLWVCQQFDRLNLFYIVHLQAKLGDLERQLDQAVPDDVQDFNKSEFERLMPEIESSLKKYGMLPATRCRGRLEVSLFALEDALVAQARHKTFREPPQDVVKIIGDNCQNLGLDLDSELEPGRENERNKHISIAAGEKGWIHKLVDRHEFLKRKFTKVNFGDSGIFCNSVMSLLNRKIQTKGESLKNPLPSVLIYPEARVRRAEKTLINFGFCFLLVCPILALSYLENKTLKVGIVLAFILALSTLTIDLSESTNKTSVALVAG